MSPPADLREVAVAVPTGDPESIRRAAAQLHRVSAQALATSALSGQARAELSLAWTGDTAERAAGELATLTGRGRQVLPQLGEAGEVLAAYSDVLDSSIRETRSLQRCEATARVEHERLAAAVRSTLAEPAASLALARADDELRARLATVHREYGIVMDRLMAAAARCSRTLSSLSANAVTRGHGRGQSAVAAALVGDLPLIQQQLAAAAQPPAQPAQPTAPAPSDSWWETALDAAAWTYNHTAVPLVNGAANVVEAAAEHPEDLLEMAAGAGMIIVGTGGEFAGVALDATGVGAVAGVPINVAAAGLVASGAGAITHGASRVADHAAQQDNRLLNEVDGPTAGGRGSPGDPLPDSRRPDVAGTDWRGRVARNGKGEVWQSPERLTRPQGGPKNADSVRVMDPTEDYPRGYVRFYNSHGQVLNLLGKPGREKAPDTHMAIRPDGTFDIPKGWAP